MPWRWNLSEYIKIPSTLAEKWNKPRRNNLYTLRWYISVGFLFGYYNSYFDFYPIISSPVTSIWFYSPVFLLHIIHYCSSLYCIRNRYDIQKYVKSYYYWNVIEREMYKWFLKSLANYLNSLTSMVYSSYICLS